MSLMCVALVALVMACRSDAVGAPELFRDDVELSSSLRGALQVKGTLLRSAHDERAMFSGVHDRGTLLGGVRNRGTHISGVRNRGTHISGVRDSGTVLSGAHNGKTIIRGGHGGIIDYVSPGSYSYGRVRSGLTGGRFRSSNVGVFGGGHRRFYDEGFGGGHLGVGEHRDLISKDHEGALGNKHGSVFGGVGGHGAIVHSRGYGTGAATSVSRFVLGKPMVVYGGSGVGLVQGLAGSLGAHPAGVDGSRRYMGTQSSDFGQLFSHQSIGVFHNPIYSRGHAGYIK